MRDGRRFPRFSALWHGMSGEDDGRKGRKRRPSLGCKYIRTEKYRKGRRIVRQLALPERATNSKTFLKAPTVLSPHLVFRVNPLQRIAKCLSTLPNPSISLSKPATKTTKYECNCKGCGVEFPVNRTGKGALCLRRLFKGFHQTRRVQVCLCLSIEVATLLHTDKYFAVVTVKPIHVHTLAVNVTRPSNFEAT